MARRLSRWLVTEPRPAAPRSSLWDAAAPLLQGLDPHRLQLVEQAIRQLDLLQAEQVLLTAPVLDLQFK